MAGNVICRTPRTVEEIFKDFSARRCGLLHALVHDVEKFWEQCDPDKENLCLYGYPDESWEVTMPPEEVPPEIPEPALGINFPRDGMPRKNWLAMVSVHSDCWLLSVAFYYGAKLNRNERKRLYSMINDLPTLFDFVTGKEQIAEKSNLHKSTKGRSKSNVALGGRYEEEEEEDGDEEGDTMCGCCEGKYNAHEFWIGCDHCEQWYHGKCVKMTPAKADSIKEYTCPSCTLKKRKL